MLNLKCLKFSNAPKPHDYSSTTYPNRFEALWRKFQIYFNLRMLFANEKWTFSRRFVKVIAKYDLQLVAKKMNRSFEELSETSSLKVSQSESFQSLKFRIECVQCSLNRRVQRCEDGARRALDWKTDFGALLKICFHTRKVLVETLMESRKIEETNRRFNLNILEKSFCQTLSGSLECGVHIVDARFEISLKVLKTRV